MAFTNEVLDEILKGCHGSEGIMKRLAKSLAERAMESELTEQLGYERHDQSAKPTANRRKGKTSEELRTDHGSMETAVPRDREGVFEPQIVPKRQKEFRVFDDKILSMYALSLTTRRIQEHLKDVYAVDVPLELTSRVTDEAKELAAGPRA
ncbi:MAG: transposase [Treponema sp.]|jgi:transposase-like protein|nr:transposase [Treponema sp.]